MSETSQYDAVLRPGDHLIVRVDPATELKDMERMRNDLQERLPDVTISLVAAEQLIVHRPDHETRIAERTYWQPHPNTVMCDGCSCCRALHCRPANDEVAYSDCVISRREDGIVCPCTTGETP